jgi:EAL domain-containing protein (putative c-di-GMP-specific phosphodiesterase class I)
MKTIAEFVESREIADKVRKIGIDYGQGYFFERPRIVV